MSPVTLDDILGDKPAPYADHREFLLHSIGRKYHLRNNIERWNHLYAYYGAEYCEIRRRLFKRIHGRPISTTDSIELCLTGRYTACANFSQASDGLVRHVCDILPIVIGSSLDLELRAPFWSDTARRVEDITKLGFIIQNKNFHNFTACLTTNPKVSHIYRRNTKVQNLEVRLYLYDHNFRGNKLYLKQSLVFERCKPCTPDVVARELGDEATAARAECCLRYYVEETLMLRDCFKHDYVFITRRCPCSGVHEAVRELLRRTVAGASGRNGFVVRCRDVFAGKPSVSSVRMHLGQVNSRASSGACSVGGGATLCDCPSSELLTDYRSGSECFSFKNANKMEMLNATCLNETLRSPEFASTRDKVFALFIYMREVLLRNEDIDMLCNKCVYEGPVLYGMLMQQLAAYMCEKYTLPALFSDHVDVLVSKMRELSHVGNLYMLISRKTNIRVDLTNDMKRLLKSTMRREKMQSMDVYSGMKSFNASTIASASSNQPPSFVQLNSGNADAHDVSTSAGAVVADTYATNSNADFLLRRKSRTKRMVTYDADEVLRAHDLNAETSCPSTAAHAATRRKFYTGMDPYRPDDVLMLYSSIYDYNTRQHLNYGNFLLQGVSAAHYNDTEFIFEQIKRPRITNQQNSSKCALIPREFVRYLSFYNIGNLSTAGRSLNMCSRSRLTFFVNSPMHVAELYFDWFRRLYNDSRFFRVLTNGRTRLAVDRCVEHGAVRCFRCFLFLVINEMPYCGLLVDRLVELPMFLVTKLCWPAVQFYRKYESVLSVSVQSGIIVVPMMLLPCRTVAMPQQQPPWQWCNQCSLYFPLHTDHISSVWPLNAHLCTVYEETLRHRNDCDARQLDGTVPYCAHHIWLSSNDLKYVQSTGLSIGNPLYYELMCHGSFFTGRNVTSVDISKTIVSINAAKRRLRLQPSHLALFETLMDQNARIVVYADKGPWRDPLPPNDFMSLARDTEREPLQHIVAVPQRNTFFCCFMFGDFEGLNCEDAYVFDSLSRPLVENVVQLKVNYYKLDRSAIKTNMARFFFDPQLSLDPGCGCTILFGEMVSYYPLSFGSTMITVKTVRLRGMYRYRFSHTCRAAYLRRGELVFDGPHGTEFSDPHVTVDRYDCQDSFKHNSKSNMLVLYEASSRTKNGNVSVAVHVSTRQLRFRVSLRNIRSTQKLQNNCGQKGMPVYRDLSDLYTERGGRVHVIVSLYSSLGRQPLSQLLEQRSDGGCSLQHTPLMRVFSRSNGGQQVGWAGYGEFFFSCDSPHDNIIVSEPNCGDNPMRMCNLTYYSSLDSGLSTAIFNRNSDHENYKNNPLNGMSHNINKLISIYRYFNRNFEFREFAVRSIREQIRDYVFMSSIGVKARLPDHLQDKFSKVVLEAAGTEKSRLTEA